MKKLEDTITNARSIGAFLERNKIRTPQYFSEMLMVYARKNYVGVMPPMAAIKAVVKSCLQWKPYLANEKEFHKLVCEEIYSMVRIHTAVITSNTENRSYIGNVCEIAENKELPKCMITIATCRGNAFIQRGFGRPREVI